MMITNNLYREIFENAPVALLLTDPNGKIIMVNTCALETLGYDERELINSDIKTIIPFRPFDGDTTTKQPLDFSKDLDNRTKTPFEIILQKKDLDCFFAKLTINTSVIDSYAVCILSFRAIHQEKKVLYELKERVKEQLALLRVTETLFKHSDTNTALSECVVHIRDGWQFPEFTAVRIQLNNGAVYTTEGFTETPWSLKAAIQSNDNDHGTLEVFYTTEVSMHGDSVFLQEENKLIDGLAKLLSIFLDQLHAINKMTESEMLIRKITNQIPANTYQFEIDKDGHVNILFASKGINEFIYDYTPEEAVENAGAVTDLIHDDDKAHYYQSMKNAYQSQKRLSIQYRTLHNKKVKWRWLRATPEKMDNGTVIWYGASQDITPIIDYIDVLEQILFDISHIIRRPVTTILGLTDLIDNIDITQDNMKVIAEKFKVVAQEMDEYTKKLNQAYNEKKLNTSAVKMGLQTAQRRTDTLNKPIL